MAARLIPGLLLGILASAAAAQTLRALLFGVEVLDVATYGAVMLLITCVMILAAYVPARRAALVDPLTLFRRG
jgi:ABC-type lipoprotein release transport system permease subunit